MFKKLLSSQYIGERSFYMARHKVEIIGVNTANIKVLSNEEMISLFKEMHNGDVYAKDELINGNLKLVLSILKKYQNRCDNMDDLFQIGCIGLIKAIDNFDLSHEVKFSTYAVPMIIGEIKRYLREGSLRVSRGIRDIAYQALQAREQMESTSNTEVTVEQVAEQLSLPLFKVLYCLDAISEPVSINEAVYTDEEDALDMEDCIADTKITQNVWTDCISLHDAINSLEEKERNILIKRYFQGKTQVEVSKEVGLSQAQVSRLEKNAISHLKQEMD